MELHRQVPGGQGTPYNVFKVVYRWPFFFFLERRARVFITFFKGSVTPPKSKAASIEVPELLAPPLSSPVQAHHAFQLSEFVPTSSFLGYS